MCVCVLGVGIEGLTLGPQWREKMYIEKKSSTFKRLSYRTRDKIALLKTFSFPIYIS